MRSARLSADAPAGLVPVQDDGPLPGLGKNGADCANLGQVVQDGNELVAHGATSSPNRVRRYNSDSSSVLCNANFSTPTCEWLIDFEQEALSTEPAFPKKRSKS